MREEHEIIGEVCLAQRDREAADALIRKYMPFIKAEVYKFTKRIPVEGADDELGIGMFAFYETIMAYQRRRGAFLRLASIGIRNRLIDYYRREKRSRGLVPLDEPVSEGSGSSATLLEQIDSGKDDIEALTEEEAAKTEIAEFCGQLKKFGLSLTDISESCPKQDRTLKACLRCLTYAKEHPQLFEKLLESGKLPVTELSVGAKVERKTIERHRKYVIAILLAYTNGFEIIRGHLQQMKREGGQQT